MPIFKKEVGNKSYDLDIYQICIYFTKIGHSGKKEHEKAIKNGLLDKSYLKKEKLKSNPFKEVHVSKFSTFLTLMHYFNEVYDELNGRIHIGKELI